MNRTLSRLLLALLACSVLAGGIPHSHAVATHERFAVQDGDVSSQAPPVCTACLLAHHRVATPEDRPELGVIRTHGVYSAEPQLPWHSAPARSLPATRAPPLSI